MPGTSLNSLRSHASDCLVIDLYSICRLDPVCSDERLAALERLFLGGGQIKWNPNRYLRWKIPPMIDGHSTRVRVCSGSPSTARTARDSDGCFRPCLLVPKRIPHDSGLLGTRVAVLQRRALQASLCCPSRVCGHAPS